jgi:hypothetical protein
VFGPDRAAYWQACLTAAADTDTPAADALTEQLTDHERQITDLRRRIHRQLLNLEDDDLSTDTRRHINQRIGQLEDSISEHQQHAAAIRDKLAERPPRTDQVIALINQLPDLADRLPNLGHDLLRALYDALDLRLHYQPDHSAIDVDITIASTPPAGPASRGVGRAPPPPPPPPPRPPPPPPTLGTASAPDHPGLTGHPTSRRIGLVQLSGIRKCLNASQGYPGTAKPARRCHTSALNTTADEGQGRQPGSQASCWSYARADDRNVDHGSTNPWRESRDLLEKSFIPSHDLDS